ncbi:MAG: GH3 auxin-responsive promoter family protein [Candidatus Melainabacteria bacterium]|nr:MAG: GH3 auxin-responsive promoter family protein [Candidatus Melainabacteria bacterium]
MNARLNQALYSTYSALVTPTVKALDDASRSPRQAQLRRLSAILKKNKSTKFGLEHGFGQIKTEADFKASVPVRDYESFRPYVEEMMAGSGNILTAENPIMFATTSGTTGQAKFIPVTQSYMKEYREASIVSGYHLFKNYPGIAAGKALSMFSSACSGRLSTGVAYGAISGAIYQSESQVVKKYICATPYEVALIDDYESRYYTFLRIGLASPISIFYTPNPSTINLLCRRLKNFAHSLIKDIKDGDINPPNPLPSSIKKALQDSGHMRKDPQRARELESLLQRGLFKPDTIWKDLALITCWTKGAAGFYLNDFPSTLGDIPVCDISYCASEGRGTAVLAADKQLLALNSHFFEFIPESEIDSKNPTVLLADELDVNQNYFVLFTTSGGLYRYNINDVIKVTGKHNNAPLIEFQHKGGNVHSFTGEKLTESHVTQAMKKVADELNLSIRFFTLVPQFKPEPHYQLWLELNDSSNQKNFDAKLPVEKISKLLDIEIGKLNMEYEEKRSSTRLSPIVCHQIEPGTYEKLRLHLVAQGTPDIQIKVSHLNPKADISQFLSNGLLPVTILG